MKIFLLIIVHSLYFSAMSQAVINGKVIRADSKVACLSISVVLKNESSVYSETMPDDNCEFHFANIPLGKYTLTLLSAGIPSPPAETFTLTNDTTIKLQFSFPPPCSFVKAGTLQPTCPEGHTDHIIPIVYGYPLPGLQKKAKKGLVILGGCEISYCDPHYYCTKHKREF